MGKINFGFYILYMSHSNSTYINDKTTFNSFDLIEIN